MSLPILLARADSVDSTVSNLTTVLICGGIAIGVLIVAMVPVMIAWSRRHRHVDALVAVTILWGLIATVSISMAALDQMNYSRQHLTDMESGYRDPNDTSDAPPLPLAMWATLGACYAGLLAWPILLGHRSAPAPAQEKGKP